MGVVDDSWGPSFGNARSSVLLRPNERADLTGCRCWGRSFLTAVSLRGGGRGGNAGVGGGGSISTVTTLGVDFVVLKGILALSFSFSCNVRFGGSGGSVDGSYTGALILPPSMEEVLEVDVLLVPSDKADIEETVDIVELIDSFESRRLSCSDGLRGGRAGDGCADVFRAGRRGGGAGLGGWGTA